MAYQYDVFISYRNQPGLVTWVKDHFQPFLQTWLDHELTWTPAIFREKVSIEAGDKWDQAIKTALGASKVVVAVLTPQYFTSKWCVAEWQSLEKRERRNPATRNKLLIPVKYSNGPHFPAFANARQFTASTDYLEVNSTVKPDVVILENKVKTLAAIIAERLKLAPGHGRFPIVDPARVRLPRLSNPTKPTP